ncbi:MAG: M15 family metallopeptidase [Acetatifactor sp.]|nr:M15 family metallopeptidase [Acetatifactor sp.]
MSVTDQCRDAGKLNVLVQVMLSAALKEIKVTGVNPLVVETYRSKERQYYLYGQGRTVAQCTAVGVPAAKAKKYAKPGATKVTWTLNSIHIQKKAVDVIPVRNGRAIWNTNDKDTKKIIEIMQKYGFEAGANWTSSPDSPHYQVKGTFSKVFSQEKNTTYVTKSIQRALKAFGFYTGKIDGIWGATTTKAVNLFRKANGWQQSGKIGKTALKKLLGIL